MVREVNAAVVIPWSDIAAWQLIVKEEANCQPHSIIRMAKHPKLDAHLCGKCWKYVDRTSWLVRRNKVKRKRKRRRWKHDGH